MFCMKIQMYLLFTWKKGVESGSSVISPLASGAGGLRFGPCSQQRKVSCPNMLSLVSFAGMTLNNYAILQIGTLAG